jgi:hypothetical protein
VGCILAPLRGSDNSGLSRLFARGKSVELRSTDRLVGFALAKIPTSRAKGAPEMGHPGF